MALVVKNPPANAGDTRDAGLISGSGRSSGVGNGTPHQYPCQENSMSRVAWQVPLINSETPPHTPLAPHYLEIYNKGIQMIPFYYL